MNEQHATLHFLQKATVARMMSNFTTLTKLSVSSYSLLTIIDQWLITLSEKGRHVAARS